jgi:hypothetical protein
MILKGDNYAMVSRLLVDNSTSFDWDGLEWDESFAQS